MVNRVMRTALLFLILLPSPATSEILVPNQGNLFFVHICNEESVSGTVTEYRSGVESRVETLKPDQCFSEKFEKKSVDASKIVYVFRSSKSAKLFEHVQEKQERIDWENLLYFFAGLLGLAAKDIFIALASPIVRRVKLARRLRSFENRFAEDLKNAILSIEFDDELRRFKEGQYEAVAWGGGLAAKVSNLQDLHERVSSGSISNVNALRELGRPV